MISNALIESIKRLLMKIASPIFQIFKIVLFQVHIFDGSSGEFSPTVSQFIQQRNITYAIWSLTFSDRWLLKLSKKSFDLLRDRTLANEQKELESSRKKEELCMLPDSKDIKVTELLPGSSVPSSSTSRPPPLKTKRIAEDRPVKTKTTKRPREIGRFQKNENPTIWLWMILTSFVNLIELQTYFQIKLNLILPMRSWERIQQRKSLIYYPPRSRPPFTHNRI